MFEREIQYYIIRGAEIADGRSAVALADIMAAPLLPPRLRTYFRAEAARLLNDEHAFRTSSRFDHSTQEVRKLERKLDDLLWMTATFRRDEFLDILERAVKINFNYLCRPQLTLRSFLFRGERTIAPQTALQRLAYFDDYPYLTFILKKWIEKQLQEQRSEIIAAEEFQRVVRKIDDQALQSFTSGDLRTLLTPMFQWIAGAQTTAASDVPTDAFIMFFDDKNIRRLSDRLAQMQYATPLMNITDVCDVIETMLNEDASAPAAPVAASGVQNEFPSPLSSGSGSYILEDETNDDADDEIPTEDSHVDEHQPEFAPPTAHELPSNLIPQTPISSLDQEPNKKPEQVIDPVWQLGSPSAAPESDNDEEVPEAFPHTDSNIVLEEHPFVPMDAASSAITKDTEDTDVREEHEPDENDAPSKIFGGNIVLESTPPQPLERQRIFTPALEGREQSVSTARFSDRNSEFKVIGGSSAVTPLADVRSLIKDDERKKFIRRLFQRNDPEYEKALDAINALRTWKEASSYIDALYLRYGVDPYAKQAIKFTDIIYGRFIKTPPIH